jgi:hypothetical protein
MEGTNLAGFVHAAEVSDPTHLHHIVHSSTLWPPAKPPPPRVARSVVGGREKGGSVFHRKEFYNSLTH